MTVRLAIPFRQCLSECADNRISRAVPVKQFLAIHVFVGFFDHHLQICTRAIVPSSIADRQADFNVAVLVVFIYRLLDCPDGFEDFFFPAAQNQYGKFVAPGSSYDVSRCD